MKKVAQLIEEFILESQGRYGLGYIVKDALTGETLCVGNKLINFIWKVFNR